MMECAVLSKLLHQLINNFAALIEKQSNYEKIEERKLLVETLRRRRVIGEQIRALAFEIHEHFKITGSSMTQDDINAKMEDIFLLHIQTDFLELAVNTCEPKSRMNYEDFVNIVHHTLYVCALEAYIPNETARTMIDAHLLHHSNMPSCDTNNECFLMENLFLSFDDSSSCHSRQACQNLSLDYPMAFQCGEPISLTSLPFLPSKQYESTKMEFESQIDMTGGMWSQLFDESQVGITSHEEKTENVDKKENEVLEEKELFSPFSPLADDVESLVIDSDDLPASWESCFKHLIKDNKYTSDVLDKEAPSVIAHYYEWFAFQDLYSFNGLVEHSVMILHVLDMLIGLPSNIFPYNKTEKIFHLKPGVHLPSVSSEATERLFSEAICAGSMFCRLEQFAEESPTIGFVMNGLKLGVKQILATFREYIISQKSNSVKFSDLREGIIKNAELIILLGEICGINLKCDQIRLPEGSDLLPYLKRTASIHKTKANSVMIAVLMKYVFTPCLRFMNRWMIEGLHEDPYEEFFIKSDEEFLLSLDDTFWTRAYTLRNSSEEENIDSDLQILNCGKSITLLTRCCPEHPNLQYMEQNPPPPLSMTFSFKASMMQAEACKDYINCMEIALKQSVKSEEAELLLSQELLSFEEVRAKVQDRWSLHLEASINKKNVISLQQTRTPTPCDHENLNIIFNSKNTIRRYNSALNLHVKLQIEPLVLNFSGILCGKAGILFSSCGFEINKINFNQDSLLLCEEKINWLNFVTKAELGRHMNTIQQEQQNADFQYGNYLNLLSNGYKRLSVSLSLKSPKEVDETTDLQFFKALGRNRLASCNSRQSLTSESNSLDSDTDYISLGPFTKRLVSILCIEECSEMEEDINAFVQMNNLTSMMYNSLSPILMLQTSLTQKIILDYIVDQLHIDELLLALRNIYFFQDEGFSQSFCEQMFDLVTTCRTINQFSNYRNLSNILSSALADSTNTSLKENNSLDVNLHMLPDNLPELRGFLLQLVRLDFRVDWPLNIIITRYSIESYNRIFSMLLFIEYISWMLAKAWEVLRIAIRQNPSTGTSPEVRKIMMVRRHMEHHARSMRKSIHYELYGIVSKQLTTALFNSANSIDSMIELHEKYLESALERCFLTSTTRPFYDLFKVVSSFILKFCQDVMKIDPETGIISSRLFVSLNETSRNYYVNEARKHLIVNAVKKQWAGSHWDYEFEDYLLSSFG